MSICVCMCVAKMGRGVDVREHECVELAWSVYMQLI